MKTDNFILLNDDCLSALLDFPDDYVDCIITDLPYGTTNNKWDTVIDLDQLWGQYKRVIKPGGNIILFGSQPFTSQLIVSNPDMFKYELIWEKTIGSGQLNIKTIPLKVHENILVFTDKIQTYNEQLTAGTPYSINRKGHNQSTYNQQGDSSKHNEGYRHARSVIKFSNPRIRDGHPTEKPVELLQYLVKTYSNPKDKVLDSCMGCGSTGMAAVLEGRRFIGIEKDKTYYNKALQKLLTL
jgi:site-specific DNA-methyltransferase (adenine-specific)